MESKPVTLQIRSESIYLHSIATLTFVSETQFSVILPYTLEIIQLTKGEQNSAGATEGGGWKLFSRREEGTKHTIEVSVLGFIEERRVSSDLGDELGNHYGMRFYPFVSSLIREDIICTSLVENVTIVLPNAFRLIFSRTDIIQNNVKSSLKHSFGEAYSIYVFSWKETPKEIGGQYHLAPYITVRLSGASLLRIVRFPVYYWLGALVGIALLSFTDESTVIIGSVAAAWLFMLQRWDSSSLPQRGSLLTLFYLLFGIILGLWGAMWVVCGEWTLLLMAPIGLLVYYVFKATNQFGFTGELPYRFAVWYANWVIRSDKRLG